MLDKQGFMHGSGTYAASNQQGTGVFLPKSQMTDGCKVDSAAIICNCQHNNY